MLGNIEFNLFEERARLNIYDKYLKAATQIGISFETFYKAVNNFLSEHKSLIFDDGYLKPEDFIAFCNMLNIFPDTLCDDYYKFILSEDYPSSILKARLSLNFNQKEFAAKCGISPADIGKFENGLKYPSRMQYIKLKTFII